MLLYIAGYVPYPVLAALQIKKLDEELAGLSEEQSNGLIPINLLAEGDKADISALAVACFRFSGGQLCLNFNPVKINCETWEVPFGACIRLDRWVTRIGKRANSSWKKPQKNLS